MCLIAFAINQHPDYPFVLVANRDEFRNRPSAPAHFWEQHPSILAGIDLKMNGTWLGMTKTGNIAFLTNYRDLNGIKENAPSRGHLVSNFLQQTVPPTEYLNSISDPTSYNGYNLLVGDIENLHWASNQGNKRTQVTSGVHALSNAHLNTPWPKVSALRTGLATLLKSAALETESLFKLLSSPVEATKRDLPKTGVGLELERKLSAAFINLEHYGTVCSTVIKVDREMNVQFTERSFGNNGERKDEITFEFALEIEK